MGDLSHREIAAVIGCAPEKVKALVFQARTALIAEREARRAVRGDPRPARGQPRRARCGAGRCDAICATASRAAPSRPAVARQRTGLALILPVAPSVGLKAAVLGGSGGVAMVAGGGAAGLAAKVAIVAAVAGTGATGGVATVDAVTQSEPPKIAPARQIAQPPAATTVAARPEATPDLRAPPRRPAQAHETARP